jgi:threonine aldolase
MSAAGRNFTSDNVVPMADEVLAALMAANRGSVASYGEDEFTARCTRAMSELFERDVAFFPVATGTAANGLALAALTPPYGAIYCHERAHIAVDECGAPEFYSGGAKLLGLPGSDGKLAPRQLHEAVASAREAGVHHVRPAALSLTQATEWGTVYGLGETRALATLAHELGLRVHVDGARFANALVHLGCSPAQATWQAGVDVLSFGMTKNGAMAADGVVFFDASAADAFELRRKRGGHLWSKSRYLSAQWLACLEGGLWLRLARHANAMASRLARGLGERAGVRVAQAVEANEVFVQMPETLFAALRAEGFEFYRWPSPPSESGPLVRLVTSYRTQPDEVDALVSTAARHVAAAR